MARKVRMREEARLDRLAEDMYREWKQDQRDELEDRLERQQQR
jgi:hypothetical protein